MKVVLVLHASERAKLFSAIVEVTDDFYLSKTCMNKEGPSDIFGTSTKT